MANRDECERVSESALNLYGSNSNILLQEIIDAPARSLAERGTDRVGHVADRRLAVDGG